MKKLMALLLATMMLFALVACQNGADTKESAAADASKAEEGTKAAEAAPAAMSANVFYYDYADTYISSVRAALDEAMKTAGIEATDFDGSNNPTTQNEQIQTALNGETGAIIVNIVNTSAEDTALDVAAKVKEKNLPLIFFNREVSDKVVQSYEKCIFVGTDAAEAGHLQGEMIGKYLLDNFDKLDLNKDGKISYVLFKGEEGNPEATYRSQYGVEDANKILEAAGKPALEFYDANNSNRYLVDPNGKWSAQAANEYMTTLLSQYSEANKNMVELVICNNDGMAEGAIAALETAGYNLGDGKSVTIPVFGVDATDAAKDLIAKGKMIGTIKQDAVGMANAIAAISKNAIEGKDFLEGLELKVDDNVAKVRIPYQIYTGE